MYTPLVKCLTLHICTEDTKQIKCRGKKEIPDEMLSSYVSFEFNVETACSPSAREPIEELHSSAALSCFWKETATCQYSQTGTPRFVAMGMSAIRTLDSTPYRSTGFCYI